MSNAGKTCYNISIELEPLARALHESGRAAVETGMVVNKVPGQPFFEWDQLTEIAKEGRRIQARYLLAKYQIAEK